MAQLGAFEQQPREVLFYTLDYQYFLDASIPELLTGSPVIYVSPSTAPGLAAVGAVEDDTKVRVQISGGVSGTRYKVEVNVGTDAGQTKEDEFYVRVQER